MNLPERWPSRLLDRWIAWRLGRDAPDLPDLPEVRRLMRLSWLSGFTFGGYERQVADAKREAFEALTRDLYQDVREQFHCTERRN